MIRIIVKSMSGFPDGTAGVPAYCTFDIDAKALETYLSEDRRPDDREVVGAEVITAEEKEKGWKSVNAK